MPRSFQAEDKLRQKTGIVFSLLFCLTSGEVIQETSIREVSCITLDYRRQHLPAHLKNRLQILLKKRQIKKNAVDRYTGKSF